MDDTDRKLLILIGAEPRIHYGELAKRLGISRQAVHHRIQVLKDRGVMKDIVASVSVSYADAIPVAVFGVSRTASIDRTLERLGKGEFSRRVVVAGGNYLYVIGYLRNISELGGYVDFVKRVAEIRDPTVGIYDLDDGLMPHYSVDGGCRRKRGKKKLTSIDLRIISSLKDSARRPTAEIADMLGVSSKTVRRHLEGMISEGSLELRLPVDMISGGDMFLVAHINLKEGADRIEVGRKLLRKYPFQDAYARTYSNLPNLVVWVFWSDSINDVRKAVEEVGRDDDVQSVMLNFAYLERMYTNWLDKLPEDQPGPSNRILAHKLNSKRA